MGPLQGVRVVELAGLGPAPFCAMLLGDMGADVLRIDRPTPADLGIPIPPAQDLLNRNKRSVALDLKSPAGQTAALRLTAGADILIEGFRPGVMENLGLGPEACWKTNPKLVYGRMTGWGQYGPLAQSAGHDLNYIAISGALNSIGPGNGPPSIPLNLVGDFGGGALYLAMGVLAALTEARSSGRGQVVDAAMVDGVANLMSFFYTFKNAGMWSLQRGENLLDGGAPFYDVYETKDGRYVSVAPIEQRFYRTMLDLIGLAPAALPNRNNRDEWAALHARFAEVFKTRTRDEWAALFAGTDACVAPVLDMEECIRHPHMAARECFVDLDGAINPTPAPRFSRTPSELRRTPPAPGQDTREALLDWGFSAAEINALCPDQAG
ncbi:MAG: CoA transferase [Rhodocyclaceae bacterium]|jgi:alpha-methylacyl-CoA racemase|nr:CoA transferase [Rhodocyclaceae bacterium]